MKIAVIGAGAIGSLVAAALTRENQDVLLIARPEQVKTLAEKGISVQGVRGPYAVTVPVQDKLDQDVDWIVLATKTQDLEQALDDNLEYLDDACLLTTQNGVRAEKIVAGRCPDARLFASIVMFGATYLTPGQIIHNFEGQWIMGALDAEQTSDLEAAVPVFSKAFPCTVADDITAMKWLKLFLNANNCLPAILGKSMQETFRSEPVCRISLQIWREGWDLVNQAGIPVVDLPDFPTERIVKLMAMPPEASAPVFSNIMTNLSREPLYGSILQSLKRSRLSEIEFINGEFVRVAGSLGTRAALNEKLVAMVHQVEQSQSFFNEQELIRQTQELVN